MYYHSKGAYTLLKHDSELIYNIYRSFYTIQNRFEV